MKVTDRSDAQPDNANSKPKRPITRIQRPKCLGHPKGQPEIALHNASPGPVAQEGVEAPD